MGSEGNFERSYLILTLSVCVISWKITQIAPASKKN